MNYNYQDVVGEQATGIKIHKNTLVFQLQYAPIQKGTLSGYLYYKLKDTWVAPFRFDVNSDNTIDFDQKYLSEVPEEATPIAGILDTQTAQIRIAFSKEPTAVKISCDYSYEQTPPQPITKKPKTRYRSIDDN